jgi:predicted cation transporter
MLTVIALLGILVMVLTLPFLVRRVEESLEAFLFAMGALAVSVSAQWSSHLVVEALLEPIKITVAVSAAGFLFKLLRPAARRLVGATIARIGVKPFAVLLVLILGIVSSAITAIVAALVLVEAIDCMKLDRKDEIRLVVTSCFAIGMGAVLTPLGEPLATIVIAKLRGDPYEAGFWFLLEEFWPYALAGLLGFAALAGIIVKPGSDEGSLREDRAEGTKDILLRTAKTYLFVMALVLLGTGFKPVIDALISKVPAPALFWINSLSAVLDNATLAAAEVGPLMTRTQLDFALLSLLISGGMLIPGNIPNIISAGKLGIKSREWMAIGLPIGGCAMAVFFAVLLALGR